MLVFKNGREKIQNKYFKMLIFGESGWRAHGNSLYYSYNFSAFMYVGHYVKKKT